MREENLSRLNSAKTSFHDPYYLSYNPLFSELRKAISKYATGNVLDIGCGNKPYELFFKNRCSSYVGCDIEQSSEGLVDIICSATDIPVEDNSKDTVFSTQVIEHVADHSKLISEAHRILKTGGYLILSGPMYWEHHEVPYDFFRFTRYGFEYILQKQGFKVIELNPCGGKWALTGQVIINSFVSSFNKKSIRMRVMKSIYTILFVKYFINRICAWLDRIDFNDIACLNYVVIGQK